MPTTNIHCPEHEAKAERLSKAETCIETIKRGRISAYSQMRSEADKMWNKLDDACGWIDTKVSIATFRWTIGLLITTGIFLIGSQATIFTAFYNKFESVGEKFEVINTNISVIATEVKHLKDAQIKITNANSENNSVGRE